MWPNVFVLCLLTTIFKNFLPLSLYLPSIKRLSLLYSLLLMQEVTWALYSSRSKRDIYLYLIQVSFLAMICGIDSLSIPISQMRKLRPGEIWVTCPRPHSCGGQGQDSDQAGRLWSPSSFSSASAGLPAPIQVNRHYVSCSVTCLPIFQAGCLLLSLEFFINYGWLSHLAITT